MSQKVDQVYIDFFDAEVKRAYGDMRKLGDTVYTKASIVGNVAYFQKKGKGLASKHNPGSRLTFMNTDFSRVSATMQDYKAYDLADHFDAKKINFDEVSQLAEVAADACGLRMDQIIIDAINAGYNSVDMQVGTTGTALVVDTLIDAKKLLDEKGVPEEDRTFIHTSKQLADLLKTTEVQSADYNTIKSLVQGELNTFLGFKFIKIASRQEGGLPNDGTDDLGFVYHKRAVGQDIGMDMETEMEYSIDYQGYIVGARFSSACTVIDDEGIVGVLSVD
jgi:hypothetical protein